MPTPLELKKVMNLGVYGLIRPATVDDNLIPEGAVTESLNFTFDRVGAAAVRPGLTALGATVLADRPCVGMWNAQGGTAIAVFSNGSSSTIYSFNGSAWSLSLDGGTASVRIRFVDFGSYTIAVNFAQNTYSSIRFWNASSTRHWHFTGTPINPQNMWGYTPQLVEVFKSRIYLAGDTSREGNASRLYFSSVISSAGNITWAPTVDYVDINPGDGEGITGLKRFAQELLVFKPNAIYRFRTSSVDPDPQIRVGTRSHESIVEGERGVYFHHDSGFYRYSGGYPVKISEPIRDIVEAIPFSQYDDIIAWKDNNHIYFAIGNVTVTEEGLSQTWKNCVCRYTESSDVWTFYSYPSDIRRAVAYITGGQSTLLVGLDNGVVSAANTGTTDNGEPIKYRLRTKWYEWSDIVTRKTINEMALVAHKAMGMEFAYQIDEDTAWNQIGEAKKFINFFSSLSIRFHRIRFQLRGMSRFEAPVFKAFAVTRGVNEEIRF